MQRFLNWKTLVGILMLLAVALLYAHLAEPRLFWGYPFGLRAEEPVFSRIATEIATGRQIEPGWYGHPGTVLIYLHSIGIFLGATLQGELSQLLSGDFQYEQDPGDITVIGRMIVMAFGVGILTLLYKTTRTISNQMIGFVVVIIMLTTTAFVEYSVRYRTDIPQCFFMLLCFYATLKDDQAGWNKYRILSGIAVGLAVLTKWPGVFACLFVIYAAGHRLLSGKSGIFTEIKNLVGTGALSVLTALIIAPRLFFDFKNTAYKAFEKENSEHLGHTSEGFSWAINKYVNVVDSTFSILVLVIVAVGILSLWMKPYRKFGGVIIMMILYFLFISSLTKWWGRWAVPMFPFFMVMFGVGLDSAYRMIKSGMARTGFVKEGMASAITLGMVGVLGAYVGYQNYVDIQPNQTMYRNGDSRVTVAKWFKENAPEGSGVLVEQYAALLSPTKYDLYFVGKRRGSLREANGDKRELYWDANKAFLGVIGLDEDLHKNICEKDIKYVVANHNLWVRYQKTKKYPDALARFAAFQKLATVELSVESTKQHPMRGPHVVIYNTEGYCNAETVEIVPGDKPVLDINPDAYAVEDEDDEEADADV